MRWRASSRPGWPLRCHSSDGGLGERGAREARPGREPRVRPRPLLQGDRPGAAPRRLREGRSRGGRPRMGARAAGACSGRTSPEFTARSPRRTRRLVEAGEAEAALQRSGYPSLEDDPPVHGQRLGDGEGGLSVRSAQAHRARARCIRRSGLRLRRPRVRGHRPGHRGHRRGHLGDERSGGAHGPSQRLNLPITHVILTHAHWDHIGGLTGLQEAGTQVIAQANFADELRRVNETGVPFRYFFGGQSHDATMSRIACRCARAADGRRDRVRPLPGARRRDRGRPPGPPARQRSPLRRRHLHALSRRSVPPEGSAEELFETMALIRSLKPRLLIHGHPPLTENFTIDALPGLELALRERLPEGPAGDRARQDAGRDASPEPPAEGSAVPPAAAIPFLVARDQLITRVYHQRTGYWKPDGEGMEVFAPEEWAAALDLLGGGKEEAFVHSAQALLDRRDAALALKLTDLGLLNYPTSQTSTISAVRRLTVCGRSTSSSIRSSSSSIRSGRRRTPPCRVGQ